MPTAAHGPRDGGSLALALCDIGRSATDSYWCCGPIDGVTRGADSHLVVRDCGAEIELRGSRLRRGPSYQDAAPDARRYLARVGAMLRLRSVGRFHLHAAGVVKPNGGAWLLCGESGSGKSTLAYVLARSGWAVLGDDGVVVEATADGVTAHGWREPMRVSIELARCFPELRGRESLANWMDPRHRTPVSAPFVRRARMAGVIVLERGISDRLTPLAPTAALATLIRQSTFLLLTDGHAQAHLSALQALVESVPCYRLQHSEAQLEAFPATMQTVAA